MARTWILEQFDFNAPMFKGAFATSVDATPRLLQEAVKLTSRENNVEMEAWIDDNHVFIVVEANSSDRVRLAGWQVEGMIHTVPLTDRYHLDKLVEAVLEALHGVGFRSTNFTVAEDGVTRAWSLQRAGK